MWKTNAGCAVEMALQRTNAIAMATNWTLWAFVVAHVPPMQMETACVTMWMAV